MDLFGNEEPNALQPPLAERMRPTKIADFVGQPEMIGKDKIVNKAIASGKIFSMILWGPPGSGKTTLARLISKEVNAQFHQISAVSSGVKEVRSVIDRSRMNSRNGVATLLFIDEIHRFNKAQQDALLHAVEDGSVTLIGATTENPSFEVIPPLLSRCRILKLDPLNESDLEKILQSAISQDKILKNYAVSLDKTAQSFLLTSVNGDARKMLNAIEIALSLSTPKTGSPIVIDLPLIKNALQQRNLLYDKTGDYHYDTISAFIKSLRGSDPDAAVYWLAVTLEGGEDPLFIARRMIIFASEDVGNADPNAMTLAVSGFQAVHSVGMPEASIVLAQMATYLASAPKSNASYMTLVNASTVVKSGNMPDVPLHLRNAPTGLMKALNYGKDYQYPHQKPEHFVKENYFPESIEPQAFYHPTDIGHEKTIRERLEKLWPERYKSDKKESPR